MTAVSSDSTIFKRPTDAAAKNAPAWAFPVSALPPRGPIRM